jgi:hypothetical protein
VKRSPLKRGKGLTAKTPLKTKKGLETRSALKPRSKKMKERYKERVPFVIEFLKKHPKCQAHWNNNCFEWAADVHEVKPRSAGGKIVGADDGQFMAVCRYCHQMITENPEEAHERGYRKWSWE